MDKILTSAFINALIKPKDLLLSDQKQIVLQLHQRNKYNYCYFIWWRLSQVELRVTKNTVSVADKIKALSFKSGEY